MSDSKPPTLEEEREARRGLAALALSTDTTVYEALMTGLEVPRDRLIADVPPASASRSTASRSE